MPTLKQCRRALSRASAVRRGLVNVDLGACFPMLVWRPSPHSHRPPAFDNPLRPNHKLFPARRLWLVAIVDDIAGAVESFN